ncbi:unnamed protein product [Darwinula stevensoni]|uniref:Uncharacterized protein n=1 Tax=Darwinula stevensoni TaxID=69355 RepID=A0A7R9ABS2_9CRUS|nr:unnamed protein product [Darwinula stevensoni]CAG0899197.1 unnamed protein product [Darwinula stevensoni]
MAIETLANMYAPVTVFHEEEKFYPSSIEFFLDAVDVVDENLFTIEPNPTPENLPGGIETDGYYMLTDQPLRKAFQIGRRPKCPTCTDVDIFSGQDVLNDIIPTYVLYRPYNGTPFIDIQYHLFYPYNRGKDICIGIPDGDDCIGFFESFGNHVGDWEHLTIRFRDEEPEQLYISCHSFGAYYNYNAAENVFEFDRGDVKAQWEVKDFTKQDSLDPEFSPFVFMDGTHPIVFSANGSHGLWGEAGTHVYMSFPITLSDVTGNGLQHVSEGSLHLIE